MGKLVLTAETLTTASAGTFECDTKVPYFTPQGLQRGVVPGMQYYRLNSALAGANSTAAQSILGAGVTLSSSTVYFFECIFATSKSAGTTSHNFQLNFGGTATVNNAAFVFTRAASVTSFTDVSSYQQLGGYIQSVANTTLVTGSTQATIFSTYTLRGTVSINAGGTFIPQYQLSAAPGGAYTVASGAYFLIYPISTSGSNTSVGEWA
jgi:hypothetical protein